MASGGSLSSESDPFDVAELRRSGRGKKSTGGGTTPKKSLTNRVDVLASTLQDTNRNLRTVDHMLGEYKELGTQQTSNMDRLRDDLRKTTGQLQDEKLRRSLRDSQSLRPSDLDHPADRRRHRVPTSPLRDYDRASSDREYTDDRPRARSRSAVRFFDDMDTGGRHLHGIHQSLRDLTSDQLRMEDDLNREIDRRKRLEVDSKRTFGQLRNTFKSNDLENAMSSVDHKLQNIQDELRSERKKRQDEVGKISTELKQALHDQKSTPLSNVSPVSSAADMELKSKLLSAESQKSQVRPNQVEMELEKVRRRLDQAEGGRDALLDQIDELRVQLGRGDQERYRLQSLIEEQEQAMREKRRKREVDDEDRDKWDGERHRLEEDARNLRAQLTKSVSVVGEYSEIRKELDRSEKQREQLSDHIQVLNKDVENREKQQVKVVGQLQEVSEKYTECERHKHQTLLQLEETLKRLRDTTREAEGLAQELRGTQDKLTESERKREEIKARAQETVKQWKIKCKKLERDADRHQHTARQTQERNESLIKELESVRTQGSLGLQQMEHLKRELGEVLAVRAQQDEQLRIKDVEVNELKALRMDLERDLRDCKVVIERLEQELRSSHEKNSSMFEEKSKLEDQMNAMQTNTMMMQNQVQQLQKELKDQSFEKVDVSAQMAQLASDRQELKSSLTEAVKGEAAAREEVENLMTRLREEKDFYNTRTEQMKSEIDQYKARESHIVQELGRRFKKEQAEYEAELQATKLEVQEDKSSMKLLKKQNEKLKNEIEKIHSQLAGAQEDCDRLQIKYHKAKEQFVSKTQLTEDGLIRAKEAELELLDTKETIRRVEKDYRNILRCIGDEVDGVIEAAAVDAIDAYKALSPIAAADQPHKWFAENKGKLEWLKNEFYERRKKELRLKTDVRDAMENNEKDRQFLISEISRQTDVLDKLSVQNIKDSPEKDVDAEISIQALKDKMSVMQADLVAERDTVIKPNSHTGPENNALNHTIDPFKDSQKEREKIHERYAKLQETMNVLRQELFEAKNSPDMMQASPKLQRTPKKTKRHVRIISPPTLDSSAADTTADQSLLDLTSKTPPPLTLSDEEFMARFVPKTP